MESPTNWTLQLIKPKEGMMGKTVNMSKKSIGLGDSFSVDQFGLNISSNAHRAEDAYKFGSVSVTNGKEETTFYISVISDGCTAEETIRSDYGSKWLVETFYHHAESLLQAKGFLGANLMREAVISCLRDMKAYISRDSDSLSNEFNGYKISEELVATLYACIVGKKETILFLGGNGNVLCNNALFTVKQSPGDMYPLYLHWFIENEWESKFDECFSIISLETNAITSLIIASDGLCEHMENYLRGGRNPSLLKEMVSNLHKSTNYFQIITEPSHGTVTPDQDFVYCSNGTDDATLIALTFNNLQNLSSVVIEDPLQIIEKAIQLLNQVDREALCPHKPTSQPDDIEFPDPSSIQAIGHERRDFDFSYYAADLVCGQPLTSTGTDLSLRLDLEKERVIKCLFGAYGPGVVDNDITLKAQQRIEDLKKSGLWRELKGLVLEPYGIYEDTANGAQLGFGYFGSEKYMPLLWFADYQWCLDNSFGLSHTSIILAQISELLERLHSLGVYVGNLRLEDIVVRVIDHNSCKFDVKFINSEVWAIYRPDLGLNTGYLGLDSSQIHPRYFQFMLGGDTVTRRDHDAYAFAVLMAWLFCKMDPFGGVLKSDPVADRRKRMELNKPVWSREVEWPKQVSRSSESRTVKEFYNGSMKGLSPGVRLAICSIISTPKVKGITELLLTMSNSLIICKSCEAIQYPGKSTCVNCGARIRSR